MNGVVNNQNCGFPIQQGFPNPRQNEMMSVVLISSEAEMYNYWVPSGMSTFFVDFTNGKMYLKSTNTSGIPNPVRFFNFNEFIPQQSIGQMGNQTQQVQQQTNQNESLQAQIDELKQIIITMNTPQKPVVQTQQQAVSNHNSYNNQTRNNKQKGGNNQ